MAPHPTPPPSYLHSLRGPLNPLLQSHHLYPPPHPSGPLKPPGMPPGLRLQSKLCHSRQNLSHEATLGSDGARAGRHWNAGTEDGGRALAGPEPLGDLAQLSCPGTKSQVNAVPPRVTTRTGGDAWTL